MMGQTERPHQMLKVEIKHPDAVASTGSYSAGVEIAGWLFISGQGTLDLETGAVVRGSIEEETRLTLNHIGKVLQSAGYSFADVVKCTCHLGDIQDFGRFDRVYSEFFP